MKVLITVPRLDLPGGVANYYRVIRRHLDDQKVYFEVGARAGSSGLISTLFRLVADSWRFHRELGRGTYNLVHLNPSLGANSLVRDGLLLLVAKLHGGLPVLVFFRGWDVDCESAIRRRFRHLFRLVYGRADAFIVLAEDFRRLFDDLGFHQPVYTETTIVDDRMFVEDDAPRAGSRAVRGTPLHILYLSRLERGKGLVEAIKSFAIVRRKYPDAVLTIAGDGEEKAAAERLVSGNGIRGVHFCGHLDGAAKSQAFKQADIYFFPTCFGEGMPNAVLEAMAFGVPVVTRPVGGLKDFFENDRMGYLTESTEPSVLAGLLDELISNPARRQEMGMYNRTFARERFSASTVASRLMELYERVIASGQRDTSLLRDG